MTNLYIEPPESARLDLDRLAVYGAGKMAQLVAPGKAQATPRVMACSGGVALQLATALEELVLRRKQAATEADISEEYLWATTAWRISST